MQLIHLYLIFLGELAGNGAWRWMSAIIYWRGWAEVDNLLAGMG